MIIMPIWYKMRYKYFHEHHTEHNRSDKGGALQSITGWSLTMLKVVIKN